MSNPRTNVEYGKKYGRLRLRDLRDACAPHRQKVSWICDCGKETVKAVGNVVSGRTRSCGRCNEIPAEEMATRKFGRLRMRDPVAITAGSGKRAWWTCDCGREAQIIIHSVVRDGTSSCGHCNDISAKEMAARKFGKLRMKEPADVNPSSHHKVVWTCDCGREKSVAIRYVVGGTIGTCGRCNEISAKDMSKRKFGRLKMRDPARVKSGSNRKAWWTCDCGRETYAQIVAVTSGRTRSCGRCADSLREAYARDRDVIRKLRTPIDPSRLPDWCPVALESIRKTSDPFHARCRLCGGEYFPRWSGIRLGVSLTCGCSSSRVSVGQREVFEFVRSLGVDADTEHRIGQLTYDMWVPGHNLVVEFNGLKWHSRKDSKRRDLEKWRNAVENGVDFIMIFEDEWKSRRRGFESLLRNRLRLSSSKGLRPSQCDIGAMTASEVDGLYERHHYLGKASSPINYGVRFEGRLVACVSFKRPSRQSKHEWELSRMVADPAFRVHGVWSKLMRRFATDLNPRSVVTFSDNRIFDGSVYGKMGFRLDGKVSPDYFWVKGNRRHHKSKLRKTEAEKLTGKTEVQLREAQGYARIWDLGKRRWLWTP